MTSSLGVVLRGAQRPRVSNVPPYSQSSGDEAIELAALTGLELYDWQQYVLRAMLGEREDGRWASKAVGLCVGRQNGKGAILEARELFGLFVLGERVILHTAHEQQTATNHFRRMCERVEASDELTARVAKMDRGKGAEAIWLHSGECIMFRTRTAGAVRGLTINLVVYDEAMHLTETEQAAIAPTTAAQSITGNVQTIYAGSAVDQQNPKHDGVPFARVRQAALGGSETIAWFEWSVPGDDPDKISPEERADLALVGQANPSLDILISEEHIAHERDVELGPRGFAVERMGCGDWPDPTGQDQRPIHPEAWDHCADPKSGFDGRACIAFDVSPDRSRACVAAAGRRPDGLWHVEVVEHRRDVGWVAEVVQRVVERAAPVAVIADVYGQAAALLPDLAQRSVDVTPVSSKEHAEACGLIFDAVVEDKLRHRGTSELKEAILGATKRNTGDRWLWSRKDSTVDISPLVACTLALWGAQTLDAFSEPNVW